MSTIAETAVEHDPREKPGGGRLAPVPHVIRIVVVRERAASASGSSHHSDESHRLTDQDLMVAEALLKKMAGPPSPSAVAPQSMFEALRPTDIVVVGQEAASVRVFDENGEPMALDEKGRPAPRDESGHRASASTAAAAGPQTRRLFGHDDRHKDTVLRVWTDSDTVEYQCDEPFTIVEVKRAGWKIYGAPDNLFEQKRGKTPYEATEHRTDAAGTTKSVWKWTSGVVPASANNQQYKMTFKIHGQLIDPDVVCGDPPPNP